MDGLIQPAAVGFKTGSFRVATLTGARLKQVLGCLQEFNLLREALLPVMTVPFTRGVQPAGFALS